MKLENPIVKIMNTSLCKNSKQVLEMFEISRNHENEGIILRDSNSLYTQEESSFKMEVVFICLSINICCSMREQENM
jgi:hypothetical protein